LEEKKREEFTNERFFSLPVERQFLAILLMRRVWT
jgi:hypothetical protein